MRPEGPVFAASASMQEVVYKRLGREDAPRLREIDRYELVEEIYYMRENALVLEKEHHEVKGWPPWALEREAVNHPAIYDRGGVIYGAFHGDRLVGYMSLDSRPVCGRHDRLMLAMLHVDRSFRGRGIGCRLLEHAMSIAKEMGATSIYVSATPSRHTVEFYMHRGFVLADELDPEQYAKEPEDIHMVLTL